MVQDPLATPNEIAISQYPRGKSIGYSMRTDRWRFTEWIDSKVRRADCFGAV